MFYMDIRHNTKKENSSKNTFHYLTRTAHFTQHKDGEELEFVKSGNMPSWAKNTPGEFWGSSDKYEIARGRTSTVLTIALPKELSKKQRAELVESFIQEFANQHQFPYTAAVHNHESTLTGEEQPHLHLMYSERSLSDGIERPAEQFFKQYRPKNPKTGGAPKITANALGQGKNQIRVFRQSTEQIINASLKRYKPTKIITIEGLQFEVKNEVSCLSNADYNKLHHTHLKDVIQIPRWKLHNPLDGEMILDVQGQIEEIKRIRAYNKLEIYKKEYEYAKQQQEQLAVPVPALEAARDLRNYKIVNESQRHYESSVHKLDQQANEILKWAKIQDFSNETEYLDALSKKQSLLMDFIKLEKSSQSLKIAQKILINDLKLIHSFASQWPVRKYDLDISIESTQIKIDGIERYLETLQLMEKNKAPAHTETSQVITEENDYEPPSPFQRPD